MTTWRNWSINNGLWIWFTQLTLHLIFLKQSTLVNPQNFSFFSFRLETTIFVIPSCKVRKLHYTICIGHYSLGISWPWKEILDVLSSNILSPVFGFDTINKFLIQLMICKFNQKSFCIQSFYNFLQKFFCYELLQRRYLFSTHTKSRYLFYTYRHLEFMWFLVCSISSSELFS